MTTAEERVRECLVCAENYVDPQLLICHHPLCKKCVDHITKNGQVECPSCRRVSQANEIVPDFRFDDIAETLAKLEQQMLFQSAEVIEKGTSNCELCAKNKVTHRCEDCKQWICSECKISHLRGNITKTHKIDTLSNKNNAVKSSLKAQAEALKRKFEEYRNYINKFQNEIAKTNASRESTLADSRILRALYISDLNKRFDEIDGEIYASAKNSLKGLEKEKLLFEKEIRDVESKWQELDRDIRKQEKQIAIEGEKLLSRAKRIVENFKTKTVEIQSLDIKVVKGQNWKAEEAAELVTDGGNITARSENQSRAVQPLLPSLSDLARRTWTRCKAVSLPSYPYAVRVIEQQLWVCHDDGITVYGEDLSEARTIPCGDMSYIYDVTVTARDEVVVAAYNGLYRMSMRGDNRQQIQSGRFTGVVLHADLLYAAESSGGQPATVYIFRRQGAWQQQHSFTLTTQGGIHTLGVSKDRLYVCHNNNHRIDVYSLRGDHQGRHGSRGSESGQLWCPYLCGSDSQGAVLVADESNHRIQTLDSRQRWSEERLQPEVRQPIGAAIHNNKLFIVSYYSKELFSYTCGASSNASNAASSRESGNATNAPSQTCVIS